MAEYLAHNDDAAFVGLEKKSPQPPSYWHKSGLAHECRKCRGFGGWILTPNAYGEGRHFKASCMDCNGWGYTEAPADHPHEWDNGKTVGNCLHTYTCKVCGLATTLDSSD